jgi:hypothetical protein
MSNGECKKRRMINEYWRMQNADWIAPSQFCIFHYPFFNTHSLLVATLPLSNNKEQIKK